MNIFRLTGDLLHLFSIFILLNKIYRSNVHCAGVSLKTQILYVIVFVMRYLDLFAYYISLYNTVMKIFFIASSIAIVYLMLYPYSKHYDKQHDTANLLYFIVPCAVVSLIFTADYSVLEILWTFSIYLESIAIMPQIIMFQNKKQAEGITSTYMFVLGGYRALYIVNWIYRYVTKGYFQPNAIVAGVIQTALYSDFMYLYVREVMMAGKVQILP